jgi:HNH endonuclease
VARTYQRKLPTTGYWIFICNTTEWSPDLFLKSDMPSSFYYAASSHHRDDFLPNQLGVLRVNDDRRSAHLRQGRPKLRKGIYAILEVIGRAERISDPDELGYADPVEASIARWRVPVTILANLIDGPLLAGELPLDDDDFRYVHRALQTSTIPISMAAFEAIVERVGGIPETEEMASLSPDRVSDIRVFEYRYASRAPVVTEIHSRKIERGSVGRRVKEYLGYRCQICSALGRSPIAFEDRNGMGFAEAHHVIPVSQRIVGSLSALNIMVLCPNHHRQAHHGRFEIEADEPDHWRISLDGCSLQISKPPDVPA